MLNLINMNSGILRNILMILILLYLYLDKNSNKEHFTLSYDEMRRLMDARKNFGPNHQVTKTLENQLYYKGRPRRIGILKPVIPVNKKNKGILSLYEMKNPRDRNRPKYYYKRMLRHDDTDYIEINVRSYIYNND